MYVIKLWYKRNVKVRKKFRKMAISRGQEKGNPSLAAMHGYWSIAAE